MSTAAHIGSHYAGTHASPTLSASLQRTAVDLGVQAGAFLPYAAWPEQQVAVLMQRSTAVRTVNTYPFGLTAQEAKFLHHTAIPTIVEHAIANTPGPATIGIKCFGIGQTGLECLQITQGILLYLGARRVIPPVGLRILISGFNIDGQVRASADNELRRRLCDAAQAHPWRDMLRIDLGLYYGDLLHADTASAMHRYGSHQIGVWRNTHVCLDAPPGFAASIMRGFHSNLTRPGALIVNETGKNFLRITTQELLTDTKR